MSDWPLVRLDECSEIVSGATPSTSVREYWGGDIPWATPKDLSELTTPLISDTPRKLTAAGLSASSASLLPPGSVLFSSRAPIGHVAMNVVPMATNQGFKSFVPRPDRLYAPYLYWWLRTNRAYLQGLGNGATFKEVSKTVVSRIEIPLPPLSEQQRIAAILDQADELRAKRQAAATHLEDVRKSIFFELFGDPRDNPKNWPMRPFDEICPTHLGKMLDAKQQTGKYLRPYVRNVNVQWLWLDLADVAEMDFPPDTRSKYRLVDGDLLICEGGEPGRAAIWRGEIEECYFQKAVHRGRPLQGIATPEYLVMLLWFLSTRGVLADHITSATIAHLTGEKLKRMLVPVPPLSLQERFTQMFLMVKENAAIQAAAASTLDNLFASLQQRAFRGEL